MKIVCAQSVLYGREAFSTLGEVAVLPDRAIAAADLADADALVIRSKTTVNRALLEGTPVRYVGTATAGFDHLDLAWLETAGVAWYAAAGCNANSVAEYFTSALLVLANRAGRPLEGLTVAVIGVGQVGSRIVRKARALGLVPLQNDPPRAAVETAPELRELDGILPEADIVTLHVPLTDDGPWPTRAMANEAFFARCKPGCWFVNASRGEVVDEVALRAAMDGGTVARAVLDVWDDEPNWSAELGRRVDLGTPHIAGYSFDGKLAGTVQVYRDLCRHFDMPAPRTPGALAPAPSVPEIRYDAGGMTDEAALWDIVRQVYDIEADDRVLRGEAPTEAAERAALFETLRKQYGMRREFFNTRVVLENASPELAAKVDGLGFAKQDAEVREPENAGRRPPAAGCAPGLP